jgi:hypothetical protein
MYPLFITDNDDEETIIPSLPGQYRFVTTQYPSSPGRLLTKLRFFEL